MFAQANNLVTAVYPRPACTQPVLKLFYVTSYIQHYIHVSFLLNNAYISKIKNRLSTQKNLPSTTSTLMSEYFLFSDSFILPVWTVFLVLHFSQKIFKIE